MEPNALKKGKREFLRTYRSDNHSDTRGHCNVHANKEDNVLKTQLLLVLFLVAGPAASQELADSYRPAGGYVSNESTARTIAEAVLVPIYGSEEINRQKPFKVALKDKNWVVEGSTPADRGKKYVGGHFTIYIDKMTGQIVYVSHSK